MKYTSSCEVVVQAPLQTVWEALTLPAIVKQYFFGTQLDTTWAVGSPLFFRGEWEGKAYEDRGTVLSFDPPKSLSYNYWSAFSGKPDTDRMIIRYVVREDEAGVHVTVEQSNVDTQERADHSAKNWQSVLNAMQQLLGDQTRNEKAGRE